MHGMWERAQVAGACILMGERVFTCVRVVYRKSFLREHETDYIYCESLFCFCDSNGRKRRWAGWRVSDVKSRERAAFFRLPVDSVDVISHAAY